MVDKNSADLAKDRLLALKAVDKNPKGEAMINGYGCTKEQYDMWITAPLNKQIALELEWGFLWRESYPITKPQAEPVVADSVAATLAQRGSRYGDFTDHARLCQAFVLEMQEFKPEAAPAGAVTPWERLSPVQRQALTVIADKIARILSGDPNYDDNWHDIQGYAKLVEERLPCNVAKREKAEFDAMSPQQQEVMKSMESAIFFGESDKDRN